MSGQHRAIRQEVSDRIFAPIQSLKNEGILYVFLVFQTEEVGQKDGGDSQTQLCCGASEKGQVFSPQKCQDLSAVGIAFFVEATGCLPVFLSGPPKT